MPEPKKYYIKVHEGMPDEEVRLLSEQLVAKLKRDLRERQRQQEQVEEDKEAHSDSQCPLLTGQQTWVTS